MDKDMNFYKKNISILKDLHPELALKVENAKDERILLAKAKNGDWTCKIKSPFEKKEVFLHSQYNPIIEARRWISKLDFSQPRVWLFLGMGLGYQLFELKSRIVDDGVIIVVEKNPEIFRTSLQIFDWRDLLNHQIELIIDERIEVACQRIREKYSDPIQKLGLEVIRHPASMNLFPQYYAVFEGEELILKGQRPIKQNIEALKPHNKVKRKRLKILSFKVSKTIIRYILKDSIEALQQLGHTVKVMELPKFWSSKGEYIRALSKEIKDFRPDFAFTVDHVGFVPGLFRQMELPYACWWVDNPFYWVGKETLLQGISDYACLFLWDLGYRDNLKEIGYKEIHYLPLATNPRVFREINLTGNELRRFENDISFIGSSALDILANFRSYYFDRLKNPSIRLFIKEAIKAQAEDPLIPMEAIINRLQGKFDLNFSGFINKDGFSRILEFASMSDYRNEIMDAIAPFGLTIYGDDGWRELMNGKVKLGGIVNYETETPRIYNASKINLNVTMAQMKQAINQRVFDVSACGGFVLSDYRPDLERLFDLGKEVVCYRDKKELKELCQYFLNHPEEREEIAHRAQVRVLHEHTYKRRMENLIDIMKERGG